MTTKMPRLKTQFATEEQIEHLLRKFNQCSYSQRIYKTKSNTEVLLYEYFQRSTDGQQYLVARLFQYPYATVFKDYTKNIAYSNYKGFVDYD